MSLHIGCVMKSKPAGCRGCELVVSFSFMCLRWSLCWPTAPAKAPPTLGASVGKRRANSHGGYGPGKVYRRKVMSGDLRPIASKPIAMAVYVAYCAHCDSEGFAWLGESSIVRAFGCSAEAVRQARRTLETHELLIDTGRKIKRCKVYQINPTPQQQLGDENASNPNTVESNTPTGGSRNPNAAPRETPTGVGTNSRNIMNNSKNKPASAGDTAGDDALAAELKRCGFADTALADVAAEARKEGWKPGYVAALRKDKPKKCGPGWIRTRLRDPMALKAVRKKAARRNEADNKRRQQQHTDERKYLDDDRKRYEREDNAIDTYIAGRSDDDLARDIRRLKINPSPSIKDVRADVGWRYRLRIWSQHRQAGEGAA